MKTHSIFLLVLLALAAPILASDPDTIADEYLAAVQAQKWKAMAEFLTDVSVYQDFTMEYFDRDAIDLVGAEAIVEFWRTSSEGAGTQDIRYDVQKRFTAGPNVVLDIEVTVRNRGEDWDLEVDEFEVSGTLITFLRIQDGKVVHHIDFVDYAASFGQIEALRAPEEEKRND